MTGSSPDSIYSRRHTRLAALMQASGLDAVTINPGPTLTYLTGLHFHLSERPVVFFFSSGLAPIAVLPELEVGKLKSLPFPVQAFQYGENPQSWINSFRQAVQTAGIETAKIGVEPRALRVLELRLLEQTASRAKFISGETALAELRMRKDPGEVAAMRKAVEIAQRAFQATLPAIRVGETEKEIASELCIQLLRHGSSLPFPFEPIVSGGPNGANPHASPSNRPLSTGDLLVIDWGASYEGYVSDLTRTLAIGVVDPEMDKIAALVADANAAGRAAARPGVTAGQVDQAARQVIEQGGYGQYFFHRTGHGIGMEGHEAPYIYGENTLILEPGMAFTIEPGIYLEGRNGVRIEDNVVITENGAESLSDLSRQLFRIEA